MACGVVKGLLAMLGLKWPRRCWLDSAEGIPSGIWECAEDSWDNNIHGCINLEGWPQEGMRRLACVRWDNNIHGCIDLEGWPQEGALLASAGITTYTDASISKDGRRRGVGGVVQGLLAILGLKRPRRELN